MKYLGVVQYLGSAYKGFERQKDYPSIQGSLEKALSSLWGHPETIHGAGRTDAGVSAKGQTFSFSGDKTLEDPISFVRSLNCLLPKDIVVLSLVEVADSFDARHSAKGKVYSYSFHVGKRDPFRSAECQLENPVFDFSLFEQAMNLYLGTHDFRDFTTKASDKDGFIRRIDRLDFSLLDNHMKVTLGANGFMTYMVRIMVGMAFRVAEGKMPLEEMKALLQPEKRKILSFKADPKGLVLEEVIYG
jgi:tRNA pseudouridine38-40 synthase